MQWLFPGDALHITNKVRYTFVHSVYRLMPKSEPKSWLAGLTPRHIDKARSIINFRSGKCPEKWLARHYKAMQLDPDFDPSTLPAKYRGPTSSTAGRGSHVRTPVIDQVDVVPAGKQPKKTTRAHTGKARPTTPSPEPEVLGGRLWEPAEVIRHVGKFKLTGVLEAKYGSKPIFHAGMAFQLHVPRRVNTKGDIKVLDAAMDDMQVRVYGCGLMMTKSTQYRVLIVKLKKAKENSWEAISTLQAQLMPAQHFYKHLPGFKPSKADLTTFLERENTTPPLARSRQMSAAAHSEDMQDGSDSGSLADSADEDANDAEEQTQLPPKTVPPRQARQHRPKLAAKASVPRIDLTEHLLPEHTDPVVARADQEQPDRKRAPSRELDTDANKRHQAQLMQTEGAVAAIYRKQAEEHAARAETERGAVGLLVKEALAAAAKVNTDTNALLAKANSDTNALLAKAMDSKHTSCSHTTNKTCTSSQARGRTNPPNTSPTPNPNTT